MSEEIRPEVSEELITPVEEKKEPELVQSPELIAAIEAAKQSVSQEAKERRKKAAHEIAAKISYAKNEEKRNRSNDAKWYIVHTYSGHEDKVKKNIEKLVENRGMQDLVFEINVPKETIVEHKADTMKSRERKVFPGYVIVKMIVTEESWYLVRNTQGVTGFVGQGSDPIPLTEEEVRRMGLEKTSIVLDIAEGDTVKVITGPFKGFTAYVEQTDDIKQTLKAKVDMFGRLTPVELEYDQVDKL